MHEDASSTASYMDCSTWVFMSVLLGCLRVWRSICRSFTQTATARERRRNNRIQLWLINRLALTYGIYKIDRPNPVTFSSCGQRKKMQYPWSTPYHEYTSFCWPSDWKKLVSTHALNLFPVFTFSRKIYQVSTQIWSHPVRNCFLTFKSGANTLSMAVVRRRKSVPKTLSIL